MTWILDYPVIRAASEVFGSPSFLIAVLPGRIVVTDLLAEEHPLLVGGIDVATIAELDDDPLGDPAQTAIVSLFTDLAKRLSVQSAAVVAWAEINAATCIVDEFATQKLCQERGVEYRSSVDIVNKLLLHEQVNSNLATVFLARVFEHVGTQVDAGEVITGLVKNH